MGSAWRTPLRTDVEASSTARFPRVDGNAVPRKPMLQSARGAKGDAMRNAHSTQVKRRECRRAPRPYADNRHKAG